MVACEGPGFAAMEGGQLEVSGDGTMARANNGSGFYSHVREMKGSGGVRTMFC